MPRKSSPKGRWTGERGNSDFILNDNYMWRDPKTGVKTSVRELKKKYGKNAILKGMNLVEGGTTIERNGQVGGHKEWKIVLKNIKIL